MQTPFKICLVGPAYPLRGGIANFNEALYNALEQRGHSVTIFSFSLQYPAFLFPGKTQFSEVNPQKERMKVVSSINSINPASWIKTAKAIKKQKPDLILIRFWLPFMGPALGSIARMVAGAGRVVIGLTDNIVPHEGKPGDEFLTRYFLRGCDGFITLSGNVANDLKKIIPGADVKVMPHPLYDIFGHAMSASEARTLLGLQQQGKYVLFFGFVRRYKGLDLLLKALAHVDSDIHLIVAGEFYDDPEPYRHLIHSLDLNNRVLLFNRFIPEAEVRQFFSAANLVAQTYHSATQSGVTQIAYHFEKPMLVTNVGGLGEIVVNNVTGFVTPPDPGTIAKAINRFYAQGLEAEFSANVKKEKYRFEWSFFCEGLEALLLQIKQQKTDFK